MTRRPWSAERPRGHERYPAAAFADKVAAHATSHTARTGPLTLPLCCDRLRRRRFRCSTGRRSWTRWGRPCPRGRRGRDARWQRTRRVRRRGPGLLWGREHLLERAALRDRHLLCGAGHGRGVHRARGLLRRCRLRRRCMLLPPRQRVPHEQRVLQRAALPGRRVRSADGNLRARGGGLLRWRRVPQRERLRGGALPALRRDGRALLQAAERV